MAISLNTYLIIFSTGVVATLHGVNCQLTIIANGLPQIINLLDNVNVSSNTMATTLPNITSSLNNQEYLQNLTNDLLSQNTATIADEIASILPALQDYYDDQFDKEQDNHNETMSILHNQQRSLSQIAETQTQMARTFNQVANILQQQSQQLQTMTEAINNVASVLTNISHVLPRVLDQQITQTELLRQLKLSNGRPYPPPYPNEDTSTLYTPTAADVTTVETFTTTTEFIIRDCTDLAHQGYYPSGIYNITPTDDLSFDVYCDMDTDGGWTVFQRRFNGSVDFYRGWNAYEQGFGSLGGEYWLGLSKIHQLTQEGNSWVLRVDLEAFDGDDTAYAEYDSFRVGSSASNYALSVGSCSGTARNSITPSGQNNIQFSTFDRDHDDWGTSYNCAENNKGGWWYTDCGFSNLNGEYLGYYHQGITWLNWKNNWDSMKTTEMKMRFVN
ncbi:uncharacterized protein [Amphiura filiformis]|uniref:uncharacterized protein n=1 Tax=Amphiura filiformis TaxID=82378 RepID=UPI003B20DA0F